MIGKKVKNKKMDIRTIIEQKEVDHWSPLQMSHNQVILLLSLERVFLHH